ncbi:CASP-like protein 4A1 [Telopea speciosissima]|uniref:CASP-like protein 4A1 n=1 Tax=Telopea speciosissima TaxID=54955 RepID=UPI001CC4462D|nr:CASP-like protein 4A1 [Telopea speciosissima]
MRVHAMQAMTNQLQEITRERPQVPPPVQVNPPPPAPATAAALGTPPPAPAAVGTPLAQVVPVPNPPVPDAPQVQMVAPMSVNPSKLSEKFQKHRTPIFDWPACDTLLPAH